MIRHKITKGSHLKVPRGYQGGTKGSHLKNSIGGTKGSHLKNSIWFLILNTSHLTPYALHFTHHYSCVTKDFHHVGSMIGYGT